MDSVTIKHEATRIQSLALTIAKGGHEFLEFRVSLYLEKDLIYVIGDLDVKMLVEMALVLCLARSAFLVRHFGGDRMFAWSKRLTNDDEKGCGRKSISRRFRKTTDKAR